MKVRSFAILVVMLAVLAGVAYHTSVKKRDAGLPSELVGTELLKDLRVNDVVEAVFQSASGTVRAARRDEIWCAPDKYNYPLDFEQVRRFLRKLDDLKIGQVVRVNEAQKKELELITPENVGDDGGSGTLLVLNGVDGITLAELLVGKTHLRAGDNMAPSPYGMPGEYPDGRYLCIDDTVVLVSDTFADLPARIEDWFDTSLLSVPADQVMDVTVSGPARDTVQLSRENEGAPAELADLGRKKTTDESNANKLMGAIAYLKFAGIADPSLDNEAMGLAEPVEYVAKTGDGRTYRLLLGARTEPEGEYYVRISATMDPPSADEGEEAEAGAESQKLYDDTTALNERLSKWTYLIRGYDAESFFVERKSLIAEVSKVEKE
jgi:hypothetical protein